MPRSIHNITYIARRNALIPQAERWANDHVRPKDYETVEDYSIDWNRCYFKRMNDLARRAGISWIK